MPKRTENPGERKLLEAKFNSGEVSGKENPKEVWLSDRIFRKHNLKIFTPIRAKFLWSMVCVHTLHFISSTNLFKKILMRVYWKVSAPDLVINNLKRVALTLLHFDKCCQLMTSFIGGCIWCRVDLTRKHF